MEQKATVCSVAKNAAAVVTREYPIRISFARNRKLQKAFLKNSVKLNRSSEWKILIITEIKFMRRLAVTGKEM